MRVFASGRGLAVKQPYWRVDRDSYGPFVQVEKVVSEFGEGNPCACTCTKLFDDTGALESEINFGTEQKEQVAIIPWYAHSVGVPGV